MAKFDTQEWQGRVGKSWAAEWQRTDRSFRELTSELTERIRAIEFAGVLDIGCGAGELSLAAAAISPSAHVHGVDISPDLIQVAAERSAGVPNLSFTVADAATWQPPDARQIDLQISRHGVMFFDSPAAAFSNLRSVSCSGGRLLFSCFRSVAENPFFGLVGGLVEGGVSLPDPTAPGPFAFADADRVRGILSEAGWRDIRIEPFDFMMVAGSGDDPVSDAVGYFSRIGPAARAISLMDDAAQQAFKDKLSGFALEHLSDGEVALGAGAWIISASTE